MVIVEEGGEKLEFEVVGVVEDEQTVETYAIAYHEAQDRFIVTDANGKILADGSVAQEVLDDFLAFADESSPQD